MENGISIIEDIIRSYPRLARLEHELRFNSQAIKSGSSRRKNGVHSDPTADSAIVELPPEEQHRFDSIQKAIRHTRHGYSNGKERLEVIRLSYWRGSGHSTDLDAYSALDVKEYQRDFIRTVAEHLGLSGCEGCVFWRSFLKRDGSGKACYYCYDTGRPRSHDRTHCFSKSLDPEIPRNNFYTVSISAAKQGA